MALDSLVLLIRKERDQFDTLILQNPDIVNRHIIQLVKVSHDKTMSYKYTLTLLLKTLLECSRDPNKQVKIKVGIALGEIGAIDPAKLDVRSKVGYAQHNSASDHSVDMQRKYTAYLKVHN